MLAEPAERYQHLLRSGYRLPKTTAQLRKLLVRPEAGDFWQADHIVPVSGGGGECDLSNYQVGAVVYLLLCTGNGSRCTRFACVACVVQHELLETLAVGHGCANEYGGAC
eukprot:COSAG01_NODE_11522_length_1915_cov_5.551762_3_plen_110_part_00